jgi:hypothetical protein
VPDAAMSSITSSITPRVAGPSDGPAPPRARELALAALAFVLVAAAVLWRPIVRYPTHTLGAWDLLAMMSDLTDRGEAIHPQNAWASDPVRQMLPWSAFAAEELREGRFPLWNPYNSAGKPLLANYQSGLLSPFQVPFYLLPYKPAALLSALAKLALAGFALYAFLRTIGLSRAASGLGGIAYLANGGHLTFLMFPHPAVSAWLPLGLLCVEHLARAVERDGARAALRPAAWLAVTMALAALSGHPETLLAVGLAVAAWAAFRLGGLWIARPELRRETYGGAVAFVVAALAAVLLAAPQIAPFLEYLARSRAVEGGPRTASVLGAENWPLLLFPDLAGSPIAPGGSIADLPRPNYHEVTNLYVGGCALLLAMLACWSARLRGRTALFAALAVIELALVYDLGGAARLVSAVVPGHHLPLIRLSPLWTVSIAALAAEGVDGLRARASTKTAALAAAGALMLAVAFHLGAEWYVAVFASDLGLDPAAWRASVADHRLEMLAWLAVGGAGAAIWGLHGTAWTRVGAGALLVAELASTAGVLSGYTPASPDRHVLPRTPELEALLAATRGERVVFLGPGEISAESNCAYRLPTISGFDAVEIGDVQRLIAQFFGVQRYDGRTLHATLSGLRLFGVRYVAAPYDWPPVGTELSTRDDSTGSSSYFALARRADAPAPRASLEVGEGLVQELRAERGGLSGLVVHFAPPSGAVSQVVAELVDVETGISRHRETVDVSRLRRTSATRCELAFLFEPIPDSEGRAYELRLRPVDPGAPSPVVRRLPASAPRVDDGSDDESAADGRAGWSLRRGEIAERGRIVLDVAYGAALRRVGTAGEHAVFEVAGAPSRCWTVSAARRVSSPDEAWEAVTTPGFDPWAAVVVEGAPIPPSAPDREGAHPVVPVDLSPAAITMRVVREDPGWLVVAQPHYPGWRAFVDGVETEIVRADFAFSAVAVPRGKHEVQLVYVPESFRYGLLAALLGAMVVAALAVAGARGSARSRRIAA